MMLALVMVPSPMPAVTPQMQQGTNQQKQERQQPQHMRPVLGQQEKTGDGEETQQYPIGTAHRQIPRASSLSDFPSSRKIRLTPFRA